MEKLDKAEFNERFLFPRISKLTFNNNKKNVEETIQFLTQLTKFLQNHFGFRSHSGTGLITQVGVEWPALGACVAAAVEVVLIVELPLPLLLGHDRVMVAVVVQDFLALADSSDGADGGTVVVVVADDVGIAAVIKQTEKQTE